MQFFNEKFESENSIPLSARYYPRDWQDILGQEEIVGSEGTLRKLVEHGKLCSAIFYGPPGTGKTAVAHLISQKINTPFLYINASLAKPTDLKGLVNKALYLYEKNGKSPVIYVEEIHRFNRHHQEILLSATEQGKVILIGSTVLNPYFYLSKALLSRTLIFEFHPLKEEDLIDLLERAIGDEYPDYQFDREAIVEIARFADGDARRALNFLEAVATLSEDKQIRRTNVRRVISGRPFRYDRAVDDHYDTISALIKSIRGSDPDGAMYWLVRMLESGEDPNFIIRRLLILAAEDIGLADPDALRVAASGALAFERVGRPEGDLILTEVVLYLAKAPKSNTVLKTLQNSQKIVREHQWGEVPQHLKSSNFPGARDLGRGKGYIYPHDHEHPIDQKYLPEELQGIRIFNPSPVDKVSEKKEEEKND